MNQADVLEYMQQHITATTREIKDAEDWPDGNVYHKFKGLVKKDLVKVEEGAEGQTQIYKITDKGREMDPDSMRPVTI